MSGTYYNQQTINRWTFLRTGTPASVSGAFALATAFGAIPAPVTGTFPATKPFQITMGNLSNQLLISAIAVEALYDPVDFYEVPYPTPKAGDQTGEAMSPAMAYGLRTNVVRKDVARGTKRLPGVIETQVGAGGVLAGGMVTALTAVCAAYSAILTYDDEGNTISFSPCVLSKEEYTTPRGNRAYRKYATLSEQLEHTATGILWQPLTTVRTQRSRQYGQGR